MPNKLVILVDFDSTLFDTPRFGADMWREISSLSGIPVEQIKADTEKYRDAGGLRYYDFTAHVSLYGIDIDTMCQRLAALISSTDYLYPDSLAFLQSLQKSGYKPIILSFGEARFQQAKIAAALAAQSDIPFIVVDQPKTEYIAKNYNGQRGVLIDDVPDQRLPVGFSEIHIDRKRQLAEPYQTASGWEVASLAQAQPLIDRM